MSESSSTPSRPTTPANATATQIPTARPYRFTWDASSRRPGPESVSGTTEGRGGDYFNQPTLTPFPLGALNTSTTTLALGALPNEWSSSKHGFHAISTVLNNPHKKQAPPKAHSSLPTVPPADLPRVRRKDFDSYLKAIAPEWERYERNNQLGREGQAQLDSSALQSHDDDDSVTPPHAKTIPPLETVPSVFFQQGFNLADPSTFAKVTEQPTSLSHMPPLLDKFSHYADTVEQHLVREISVRSTSFFAALTNLQDLQSESDVCLDRIAKLRGLLNEVDERTAKKGLEVVRKCREVEKVQGVREAVKSVANVVEMTRVAKSLVGAGQWGEALSVVEELESMWDGEQVQSLGDTIANGVAGKRLETMVEETEDEEEERNTQGQKPSLVFPLSTLTAFSELPSHLRALTLEIATSLSQELVIVLRHDLEERITLNQGAPMKANGHVVDTEKEESLRDRLKPLLQNLTRTRRLKDAVSQWREVVLSEVRRVAKEAVSGFDKEWDEDKEENRTTLVQHLKSMEHSEFMPVLQKMYKRFLALIEGVQALNSLINGLLESILISAPSKKSLSMKAQSSQNITDDLSDLLSSITELSHTTSAKLLHARTELHSILSLPRFLALYFDSMAFVVKCEVTCRRMIIGLRGVVIRQASVYLSKFHQGRIEKCARVVLDEMWNQVEVGPDVQGVVDVLVKCAVKNAEELKVDAEAPSRSAKGISKHLKIEDRSYYIVSATAEVLILLVDYLKIVVNLSTLTKDTINKVVEFLMTFNSRTCQLVLGAGAMRSAGLKHITAKHLALASQSLSVVSELIPYVRETFRRHLNQAEAVLLVDFDKLKRDYQVHQTEIHAKLISIMGDRLTAHIESLKPQNFLLTHSYVMTEVFAGINHRLSEVYGKIELPNQEAKARLLADAKFLHKELSGLKNVMAPMGMLETVVSEKQVPRANVPSPVPTPTRSNTLTANQRLKGLLSRSSTSVNHSNKPPEKALPMPNQTSSNPRTSTSTPPPPPLPTKSPSGSVFLQNAFASASTLALSSETASASNLALNVSAPSVPDRVLSASPPVDGAGSESQENAVTASLSSQQNGHDTQTPIGSPHITPTEAPLPQIPPTERAPDMKV
ncbi:Vacuolar protein sorting-associated protein 54 [Leucoagaricus sp. SymC.cos]|nr:Vacuolar protein sorting-associated protein 54 [Leucoagaricus sp. SymC.cos]